MKKDNLILRENILPGDVIKVANIIRATGFFSDEEIEIACELIEDQLGKGADSGYYFLFGEVENEMICYTCFGPVPATLNSFDLYWIAVHPNYQGKGFGKILLKETEKIIAGMNGRNIFIETSGKEQYKPTRAFYLKNGYKEAAVLEDFYAPGDNKFIYVKKII